MKNRFLRSTSFLLSLVLLFSIGSISAGAYTVTDNQYFEGIDIKDGDVKDNFMKLLYNTLNVMTERLAHFICTIYPDNANWEDIDRYTPAADGFMPGRSVYRHGAAEDNKWSLGFGSLSVIPDDIGCGKYNLGRDVKNRYAKGVYDDQRVRISVIDDNSGEGAVIFGAIDAMGITSTDVRSIRKGIIKYCKDINFKVSSINIAATHAHSVLDVQGVSTDLFYKLFFQKYNNLFGTEDKSGRLDHAEYFKEYFVNKAVEAAKLAITDMEDGKLYFAAVDGSNFIKDKRGLIAKEDIPPMATLKFVPASGSENTYITDITCHATSFSANNNLVGSDYIYYLEEYLKNNDNGSNVIMVPGALGQVSRDNVDVDTTGMSEHDSMGANTKELGYSFARCILAAEFSQELDPIINVTHREIFIKPENSVLALACEINLVNNKVYKSGLNSFTLPSEMGYLEFGNKVAFALFPNELYPEVFWGDDIAGNPTWDGKEWPYDSLANAVDGIDIYAVSLINDSLGYVVTDNNFAFMGHIIGDGIADETLSVGKHMGSQLAEEYNKMIQEFVK